jgi:hypothetical protein
MSQFTCFQVPNFAVWAYRRLHPEWIGRELLIQQAGKVVACSQGLTPLGVQPGMAWESAVALSQPACPVHVLFAAHRIALVWEELLEELYRYTPFLLPQPFETCWAQLDAAESRHIAQSLGLCGGRAADRDTAQLAALSAPAGECRVVPPGGEHRFADALPLPVLVEAGVGWASLERLHWLGFAHVGELRRLTVAQLSQRFSDGELLFRLSRPGSQQPLGAWRPPEELVGEALCEPLAERPALLKVALERALERLEGRLTARVTLELEYEDGTVDRRRRWLKQSTAQPRKIWLALQPIWKELAQERAPERIRVRLGGLRSGPRVQTTLWHARMPVRVALKQLHDRFPGLVKQVAWHPGADGVSEESWSFANP